MFFCDSEFRAYALIRLNRQYKCPVNDKYLVPNIVLCEFSYVIVTRNTMPFSRKVLFLALEASETASNVSTVAAFSNSINRIPSGFPVPLSLKSEMEVIEVILSDSDIKFILNNSDIKVISKLY